MEQIRFFSADYRDGRVRIGGKTYPAGYYCVQLFCSSGIYCSYFQKAVLPIEKDLYTQILKQNSKEE